MDLRTEKTRKNIVNAFITLRAKKPLEKITIKELADLACINKATFYRHYTDIYALSESIEDELIADCIASIPTDIDLLDDNGFYHLTNAFVHQSNLVSIIFSGSRMDAKIQKLHEQVMRRIYDAHPEFENELEKKIVLSSVIYGNIYAYNQYENIDFDFLIGSLSKVNHALKYIL